MTNKFQYTTGDLYLIDNHVTIMLCLIDSWKNKNFKASIFHFNQAHRVRNLVWNIYQSDMKIND